MFREGVIEVIMLYFCPMASYLDNKLSRNAPTKLFCDDYPMCPTCQTVLSMSLANQRSTTIRDYDELSGVALGSGVDKIDVPPGKVLVSAVAVLGSVGNGIAVLDDDVTSGMVEFEPIGKGIVVALDGKVVGVPAGDVESGVPALVSVGNGILDGDVASGVVEFEPVVRGVVVLNGDEVSGTVELEPVVPGHLLWEPGDVQLLLCFEQLEVCLHFEGHLWRHFLPREG